MASKIKVDTIENVAGSGNVSLGSGHNLVVPGDLTVDTSSITGTTSRSFTEQRITSSTSGIGELRFADTTVNAGYIKYDHSGNNMILATNVTERLRIDSSGNVQVGSASSVTGGRYFDIYNTGSTATDFSILRFITQQVGSSSTVSGEIYKRKNGQFTITNGETNSAAFTSFQVGASERMRIDSSGNVGIGTSSPAATSSTYKNLQVAVGATVIGRTDDTPLYLSSNLSYNSGWKYIANTTATQIALGTNIQFFNVPSGTAGNAATLTERMRLDASGKTFVTNDSNVSDNNNANLCVNHSVSTRGINLHTTGTGGSDRITFQNDNGTVGTINTSGSSTSYGTSSDYRLKENVEYDFDATTRLKQLKPARFNFIADADTTVDGFLAHEVQSVVPEAITGEKDAVDADGNPEYQGIDQSKLVPLLVKTIQELEARITALESN